MPNKRIALLLCSTYLADSTYTTGNTLEARVNASFGTLAAGDATKTFRDSGRALGMAPPPSLRPHSAVRRRMENEGRSEVTLT